MMPKIIFAKQNVKFYENLPHRRSYWNPLLGPPIEETIKQNIELELQDLYPDSSTISNKMNISIKNESYRTTDINIKQSYKTIYPNSFEFWNNINHAKIEYDDGSYEYLFVVSRECKNLAVNLWGFVFKVDLWRTYWPKILPELYNSNIKQYIAMGFEDRYDENGIMTTLTTKNSMWNKISLLQKYNSNIALASGESQLPWDDVEGEKYIDDYDIMKKSYSKKENTWTSEYAGYPYLVLQIPPNNNPRRTLLTQYYATPNILEYYPIVNDSWVQTETGIIIIKPEYFLQLAQLIEIGQTSGSDVSANCIRGIESSLISPFLVSLNQAIKPIIITKPFRNKKQSEFGYKIHNNDSITSDYKGIPSDNMSSKHGMNLGTDNTNTHIEPKLGNDCKLNNLCDERLNVGDILSEIFIKRLQGFDKNSPVIDSLEPILYNDDLFTIMYRRANDTDSTEISPLHYFFEEDLNDMSIFIKGYQFIQPDATYLLQYIDKGIYKNYNSDGKTISKSLMFNPELQAEKNRYLDYLLQNKSRINSGILNSALNAATSFVPGLGNLPLFNKTTETNSTDWMTHETGTGSTDLISKDTPFMNTEKFHVNTTHINNEKSGLWKLGNFIPVYSAIKGTQGLMTSAISAIAMQRDMARTPGKLTGLESSILRQLSNKAYWIVNWIDENIQKQICTWLRTNGYLINKHDILKDYLGNRIYYNIVQTNSIKLLLQNVNISDGYKEYFDNILSNKITLWHNNENGVEVGDYSKENWETKLYQIIKIKEIDMDINNMNIKLLGEAEVSQSRSITNFNLLENVTATSTDDNIASVIVDSINSQITVTGKNVGTITITVNASNAFEPKSFTCNVEDGRTIPIFEPEIEQPYNMSVTPPAWNTVTFKVVNDSGFPTTPGQGLFCSQPDFSKVAFNCSKGISSPYLSEFAITAKQPGTFTTTFGGKINGNPTFPLQITVNISPTLQIDISPMNISLN